MFSITRYSIKSECLAQWVKFIWYFEAKDADIHQKLLPTDCIDIVLNLSGNMIYETSSRMITAQPFHVNGLRGEHSYIHQTGTIQVFGISCYCFGLSAFINKSLKSIQDEIVDLNTLSVPLALKLKSVVSCDTIQDTVGCIEMALCSELHVDSEYVRKANLIYDFMNTDNDITIQSFCMERGINIKTFERTVLRYTGYTPKILQRIKRFQAASNQLVHQNSISLSEVAYDNSYSDQAHFIKEFRKFSGAAPSIFQQEKASIKENAVYCYI